MNAIETAFNIAGASTVVIGVLYARHLLNTAGRDHSHDPELVKQFLETAPYHLLEDLVAD